MRNVLTENYLTSNRTKRATRGWKSLCPSCGGNDLWYTPDTGSAFCFECGSSYVVEDEDGISHSNAVAARSVRHLDVNAIRHVYESAASLYSSCLQKRHRDYLYNRGLDDSAIDRFRLGYCPDRQLPLYQLNSARDAGICNSKKDPFLADRIVFPYIADGSVTDVRGRAVEAVEPRYKSPLNDAHSRGAVFPFNHDYALERAKSTGVVILTEGEFKAVLADMHGFACVALPGMLSWRSGTMDLSQYRVVVIFDNSSDPSDRMRVDRAVDRVYNYIPSIHVGVLPLLGSDKQDIDSFLLHRNGGASRFASVVNNAVPYSFYRALRRF